MGAEYKVHTKLLTEFETLGVLGENNSGIIKQRYALYTPSELKRCTMEPKYPQIECEKYIYIGT